MDQSSSPPPHALREDISSMNIKEGMKEMKGESDELTEEKRISKSFWRFKRSSSLNCVSGYGRSLCPLPLLSRSNSTGSAPGSVKRVPLSRDGYSSYNHKQRKQAVMKHQSSSFNQLPKTSIKEELWILWQWSFLAVFDENWQTMSPSMSPRLSFSIDFCQEETIPTPLQSQSCSSNFNDFDFCFHSNEINLENSSADELFVDGKILPVEIKKKIAASQELHRPIIIPSPFPPLRAFVESASTKKDADKDSRHEISEGIKSLSKHNEANHKNFINQEIKKKITPLKQIQQPVIPPPLPPLRAFLEAAGIKEYDVYEDSNHESFNESNISCKKEEYKKKNSRSFRHVKKNTSMNSNWSFGGLCPFPLFSRSKSALKTAGKRVALSKEIQNHKHNSEKLKPLALAHLQISSLTSYRHQKLL
ncbi:hypothetical protein GH714_032574 [Hevea brasiliensis]|uniref:Uncharacterized protein n=1 Tax=Hevea brasiliensis TaxID=3981 RepID=A0A6A6L312_HEVBR|nr:hypothetical protein GH714_032574 [Hevea brasiliensis]